MGAVLLLLLSACGSGASEESPARHPGVRSDFDGDGYGDLVVGDTTATVNGKYAAGFAAVLRGSARGPRLEGPRVVTQNDLGLGKAGEGGAFGSPDTSVTADLDGDGRADFVTQAGRKTVFVVWGSDQGLTGTAARLTGSAPLTGDVDGDGHTDLVVGTGEDNAVRILLGPFSRQGTPRRSVSLDLTPSDPEYPVAVPAALGDVTGDGKDDLLVSWSILADYAPVARATVVYRGAADGKLVEGPRLEDGFYGSTLTTADVNHDGYADVVAGLPCEMLGDSMVPVGGSRLMILYGGTLKTSRVTGDTTGLPVKGPFMPCTFGGAPAAGDVDGDGYPDVAFSVVPRTGPEEVILLRGSAGGLTTEGARAVPGGSAVLLDSYGSRAAELVVRGREGIQVWRGGSRLLSFKETDLDLGPEIARGGHGLSPVR
ncbi:VCBS repeat-containing protein [Streptomyces sp900105755]|uniref:FG-GAP repeat domain-containing protein n=1 Tax=unclassified Streptomyces TaxID=2593676 RepID=UPI00089BE99A|nr:VCBS repeat-containing protein [Streptomyces sp. Ag109_O5-10]SEE97613.1 FG-GAP repeat-containing protein [Streptomyces sp. Ag109_O5-10]